MASPGGVALDPIAQEILLAAAEGSGDYIHVAEAMGPRLQISTGGKQWIAEQNLRLESELKDAIQELVRNGLIKDTGHKREVFSVTKKGFETADALR